MISRTELSDILSRIAATLDLPDHLYEDATLKYEDIGDWLAADESALRIYSPEIYSQGSFRLGTAVRPLSDNGEYDIDLVCHLTLKKEEVSQKQLKEMVGERLRQRDDLARILSPSRRCWTLDYPQQFHMDVLPAIPNAERQPTGILLTDTELVRWQMSNPKAYANWFYERMKVLFLEKRMAVAKSANANVEDVPEWQVRTPLQRGIQLLKRHRDIYFDKDPRKKPVSIILTTLAAQAYKNQADLYDALAGMVREMPLFIQSRNGQWWVANPVEPGENFADKWNEKPELREAFLVWLGKVQIDFAKVARTEGAGEALDALTPFLGDRPVGQVARGLGIARAYQVPPVAVPQVPALSDAGHRLNPLWPIQQTYTASLTASVHSKKSSVKKLWDLMDRPVLKNVWLKFSVKTNAPPPYQVQWQVVNTGPAAAAAGGLRGDFYESNGSGPAVRWESTSYAGTHWVEAFIIKAGVCVARSGPKYVKVR